MDNDTISSLQVAAGYQIKACENLNLGGNCVTYIPGDYGWGGDAANDKFSSVQITTYASGSGSANRANQGEWSAVVPWPLIPIQAALNPDGQLMTWSSVTDDRAEAWYADVSKQIQTRVDLWNPASNLHRWIDEKLGNDIFCSGFTHAADGSLIVVGGSIREGEGIQASFAYNFVTSAWKKLANLTQKRWYSSATALASGEVLALGTFSDLPEVFNGTGWRQLTNARNGNYNTFFPWTQSAPNGKVFYAGPNSQLSYLDTAGAGNITVTGQRDGIDRYYGSYATYDTGKILTAGGSNLVPGSNQNASTTASVINLNGPVPQVSSTESMKNKRTYHTLTILSDGQVLATGGTTSTAAYDANAGVYAAELWNPGSQKWSTLASQKVTRQYHSFALLLPDGRVASGGGGYCCDSKAAPLRANNPINKPNVEFFSPPYLFDAQGNPARRPAINSAPEQISYNQGFNVALGSLGDSAQISKLHLIRLGSVTHGVNMEQRLTPLRFNQSGNTLNANITPPGYYMLIAVNDKGVPSVARMIKVGQASWTARSIREKLQSDEASIPHEHDGADADHDHAAQAQTADHDHADQDHGAGELAVKHTHNE
ncbi:galactose oxidase early set domain-containing protein [Deinococcus marmoris]|uniref:Uncharacterized protein n=1 Tax=Deinococcus marmoris TaxID=249408 RepID=A0A1U7NYZ8_9DEIO|nr:galactose oxidase early set domain-containing protein [Deinococcus marmoris]OLV18145.1 hypothetical protein BOO71_0006757 [Deinococcus marmoris]